MRIGFLWLSCPWNGSQNPQHFTTALTLARWVVKEARSDQSVGHVEPKYLYDLFQTNSRYCSYGKETSTYFVTELIQVTCSLLQKDLCKICLWLIFIGTKRYTYTHIYIHTHTHKHTYSHIRTLIYTHTHMYTYTHVHKHTNTHIRTHIHTHTHIPFSFVIVKC